MTRSNPKAPFPDAVRALTEEERRIRPFVPKEDTLIAYQAGELSEADAEQVRAHLAVDPEAARFVAELDQFLEDVKDESLHLSEHEAARGAQAVRRKAAGGGGFLGPHFYKIAAGVLLATTVVSVMWGIPWGSEVGVSVDALSIHDLGLDAERRSAAGDSVEIPIRDSYFVLTFGADTRKTYVDVVTAAGKIVEERPEVREYGSAHMVLLNTDHYPQGSYVLRVLGTASYAGEGPVEVLHEYPFRVTYIDEGP